jgi:hypothetical protein
MNIDQSSASEETGKKSVEAIEDDNTGEFAPWND